MSNRQNSIGNYSGPYSRVKRKAKLGAMGLEGLFGLWLKAFLVFEYGFRQKLVAEFISPKKCKLSAL